MSKNGRENMTRAENLNRVAEKRLKWGTIDKHNLPASRWLCPTPRWLQSCLCSQESPIPWPPPRYHLEDPLCSTGTDNQGLRDNQQYRAHWWHFPGQYPFPKGCCKFHWFLIGTEWMFLGKLAGCLATAHCQELTFPEKMWHFVIHAGLTELGGGGTHLCGVPLVHR